MRFCLIKRKIGEPVQVLVSHYFARAVVFFASEANYLLPVLNLENLLHFVGMVRVCLQNAGGLSPKAVLYVLL